MNPMHLNLLTDIRGNQKPACVVVVQEKITGHHVKYKLTAKVSFFYGFNKKGALQTAWSIAGAKILTPYEAANICGIIRNKGYYSHVAYVQLELMGGAA